MSAADRAATFIAWVLIAVVSGLTWAAAIRRNQTRTRTRNSRKGDNQ